MNNLKKILGFICLIAAPLVILTLIFGATQYIDVNGSKEINNPVIWVIIITIFTPIAIGLFIFGKYAIQGEYNHLPENSDEV